MKRYRNSLTLPAAALSVFCLVFLSLSAGIPAMGQTGFDLATPSQAETEGAGDGEREAEETEDAGNGEPEAEETEDAWDGERKSEETEGAGDGEREAEETEFVMSRTARPRIATGSNAGLLEVVTIIAVPFDLVIEAEAGRAEEMISQALRENPTGKSARVMLSDGSRRVLSIEYDYDSLDESQTGLVMLSGTIVPPDGCDISPELAKTELPILLYHPESPCELPLTSVEPLSTTRILLPEHAVLDDLMREVKSERRIYYILEGGLTWSAGISWNFDAVDFGTPGTYRITAQPVLPDGIFLPDGLPETACDIIIQPDNLFLFGPPEFTGLYMTASWTKETPDLEKFRCFYAVGDGPWIEDTEQDLISIPDFNTQSFQLEYYEGVFFDTPYYFQLSYDGEYSNILKVSFSEGQIHYRFYDGDRDGGDREDQKPPDISQTVPPGFGSTGDGTGETQPGGTVPDETEPEETLPPKAPGGGETRPAETPSSDHSSDHGSGSSNSSGSSQSHGGSSVYKGLSGNGYAAAGPGVETQAASPLSPTQEASPLSPTLPASLPSASEPEIEPEMESLPDASAAGAIPGETNRGNAKHFSNFKAGAALEPRTTLEEDTADYTVYSGRRLQKYIELNTGRPLLVTKHRIQLEIPLDDGVFSRMEDLSLLRVEILSLSEDAVHIELSIDGTDGVPVPLEEMPDLTITMPYPTAEETTALQVVHSDGTVLTEARVIDRAQITFTVNRTGTFRIQETSADGPDKEAPAAPDNSRQTHPPLIPAVPAVLFLFALSGLRHIGWTRQNNEEYSEKHAGKHAEKYAEKHAGKYAENDKKGDERP